MANVNTGSKRNQDPCAAIERLCAPIKSVEVNKN